MWIHSARGIAGESWRETATFLHDQGFNAVFVNFAWGDVADYPSKVLPVHPDVVKRGDDPLRECLDACHEVGLQVHFWKVCWNMGHRTPETERQRMREAGRVQVTADGKQTDFLSPHLAENRALEVAAIREVLEKYPVDGIHLDYVRYSSSQCDFSDSAREAFEKSVGETMEHWPQDVQPDGKYYVRFCEWRRQNNNALVKEMRETVKGHEGVVLSAAVYPVWDDSSVWLGQDAEKWLRLGWVDALCPMNYTTDEKEWCAWLSQQIETMGSGRAIYPGIACHKLAKAEDVAKQIGLARKAGVDGFLCFPYNAATKELYPELHKDVMARLPNNVLMGGNQRFHFSRGMLRDGDRIVLVDKVPLGSECRIRVDAYTLGMWSAFWERDGLPVQDVPVVFLATKGSGRLCSVPTSVAGKLRLCIRGQAGWARSQVLWVMTEEESREEQLREGPPQFAENGGRRIAVWGDGAYGATSILECLRKEKGLDVAELRNFHTGTLARCHVAILPQPRYHQRMFRKPEMAAALERYVRNGGTLLVTHALVGTRLFPNLFPSLVAVDGKAVATTVWRGTETLAPMLGTGERKSSFVDMIPLRPLKDAVSVVETREGKCVVAVCRYGLGKYIACGLGLGIGADDKDAALSADDEKLLLALLRIADLDW